MTLVAVWPLLGHWDEQIKPKLWLIMIRFISLVPPISSCFFSISSFVLLVVGSNGVILVNWVIVMVAVASLSSPKIKNYLIALSFLPESCWAHWSLVWTQFQSMLRRGNSNPRQWDDAINYCCCRRYLVVKICHRAAVFAGSLDQEARKLILANM